jgi:very-short-patch-repair endonuclease
MPEPKINTDVAGFEVDYYWPEARLVVELDSYEFHKSRAKFESDRKKDAILQRANQRVLRVTYRRLHSELAAVIEDVKAFMQPRV